MESPETKQRFMNKVATDENGCWQWTGGRHTNSPGYFLPEPGVFVRARRWIYEEIIGAIPKGDQITATCNSPLCVNPEHLEAITCKEKTRRFKTSPPSINLAKTSCRNGHAFDETNTIVKGNGVRACRECRKAFDRRRSAAKREARIAAKPKPERQRPWRKPFVVPSNFSLSPIERFSDKYQVDEAGCWIWTGGKMKTGYGSFAPERTNVMKAHRWSYQYFHGSIPQGLQVHHKCGVRSCVNPDHLEVLTPKEHSRKHWEVRRAS